MKFLSQSITALSGFCLLIISIFATAACSSRNSDSQDSVPPTNDSVAFHPDFYQEWKRVGKMDFGSMTVTKTVTTDRTEWYKIGRRVAVYSFDIYLKAGIDLDQLRPEDVVIDETSKTIRLRLPEMDVRIAGRSSDLRLEYEHIDLFRSRPDSRERAVLKEMANEDFQREMKQNPAYIRQLRATADEKARAYFTALGEAAGYKVEFTRPLYISTKD
ncbi:MAG: DUF4230 domain-containing protein [Bacteroidales bacterium]|nr:DUF4230 domain-containing protein [Bacteroidales bacterium]